MASNHSMFRTVCAALRTAVRIASSTLVSLLPTISVSRYTWSLTGLLLLAGLRPRPWHESGAPRARPARTSSGDGRRRGTTYVLPVPPNTSSDGFRHPRPPKTSTRSAPSSKEPPMSVLDPRPSSPHGPRLLCGRRPRAAGCPGRRRRGDLAGHRPSVRGPAAVRGPRGAAQRRRHRRGGAAHLGAALPQRRPHQRPALPAGLAVHDRPPRGAGDPARPAARRSRARTSPTASPPTTPTSRRRSWTTSCAGRSTGRSRRLPASQRRIVRALLREPASYDALSEELGIPRGSLGPLRGRAVRALRAQLEPSLR